MYYWVLLSPNMSEKAKGQETKFTPGPWRWEINLKSKSIHLVGGKPRFDETVIDFSRWGMSGAKPTFRLNGLLVDAEKFAQPIKGREHHASWCQTLNHPDARLIAAAPSLYEACKMVDSADTYPHEWPTALEAVRAAIKSTEAQ
jgi:hypothetical protein